MLENFIFNDFILTFIGQIASFCGLLVCLTISMYGGNETGKPIPETYTYEEFIEYRRVHGTDATKKKLKEIEAKRLEKTKEREKKKVKTHPERKGSKGSKGSKNGKKNFEDKSTKKVKKDQHGISSRTKKPKKKDPLAQSDRLKTKHRHPQDETEVYIDEPNQRIKPSAEHVDGPLVEVENDFFDHSHKSHKSYTGSTSSTSPSQSSSHSTSNKNKHPTTFSKLDMSTSGRRHKRKKDNAASSHASHEPGTSREPLTANESTRMKKELQPVDVAFPSKSPAKSDGEDDEFTPTVFEIIKAPVKPIIEKIKKPRKFSELCNTKAATPPSPASFSPLLLKEDKESKKKKRPLEEEDKTILDDGVGVDESARAVGSKPKPNLNKIKEQLIEKHQKMIERQKKHEKKKSEQQHRKTLSKDSKKHVVVDDPAAVSTKKKTQRKIQSINKKNDKTVLKPTEMKAPTMLVKSDACLFGKEAAMSIQQTPSSDSKENYTDNDTTLKEITAEEDDKTEEDEHILTVKDEKIVRGAELRKIQSEIKYVERPPGKMHIVASARIFGHRCENPRLLKASINAIKKAQKNKKPMVRKIVTKSRSSSAVTSSTTSGASTSTSSWSTTTFEEK